MKFSSYINIALKEKECEDRMQEVIKLLRKCFKKVKFEEISTEKATIFSLKNDDKSYLEVAVSWIFCHKLYQGYDRTIIISITKEYHNQRTSENIQIDSDRIQENEFVVTLTKIKHFFDKLVTSLYS